MTDKVASITGAGSGIGRAAAETFAANGARVVLAARREDELASLVLEIEARGGKATAIRTDVSVASDVEKMVVHAVETFGRLDYAVNNAGWDRVLGRDLKGTLLCLNCESRAMLAGGRGGAIVNVGLTTSVLPI
jgi:NAD(P)-dependent dehydrogenase (short-subunit alcohol dehydrogenase family)